LGCGVLIFCALGWMMRSLQNKPAPVDKWSLARRSSSRDATGPGEEFPRLQLAPREEMEALRAREQADLHSYGWIDRTTGVVRIPLGRALDLILERGLPATRITNGSPMGRSNLELLRERALQREKK
jgi:hypothetical protein